MDCIFCKIISKEIGAEIVFENEHVIAFNDINPQAPVHVLVVPKIHINSADEVSSENSAYIAKTFEAIAEIAKKLGIENKYRVITNCGADAGQSVLHIHFHVLSGSPILASRII